MKRRVLVQVDEGTHAAWKSRAFSEGRSMSELARDLIERAVLTERDVRGVVAESRSDGGRAQKPFEGDSRTPAQQSSRSVSADAPVTLPGGVPTQARAHMRRDRPAVECKSRLAVDGVCPDCGKEGL